MATPRAPATRNAVSRPVAAPERRWLGRSIVAAAVSAIVVGVVAVIGGDEGGAAASRARLASAPAPAMDRLSTCALVMCANDSVCVRARCEDLLTTCEAR